MTLYYTDPMAESDAPSPRKDRLIQTRVPRDLEATLRLEARRRRLTVSHLIRSVLEDAFDLVDDVVADGVVTAAREVGVGVPVVVRLEGTNVDRGKQILLESGLDFEVADGMDEAARKVVAAAEGA